MRFCEFKWQDTFLPCEIIIAFFQRKCYNRVRRTQLVVKKWFASGVKRDKMIFNKTIWIGAEEYG